ncbi:hypothetical protein [Fundicoccus culcitae]|uniref:histidine kinase n=1 Tax=Fundicoccus culcitae TaxID=2969821 RepID=A0ABY5P4Z1_9LACT|nr:hypothetical protein [Fundicoccus culcitae]UUX33614.1 hypothetical protein NRE15_12010 [Fundicoccus culcitae]
MKSHSALRMLLITAWIIIIGVILYFLLNPHLLNELLSSFTLFGFFTLLIPTVIYRDAPSQPSTYNLVIFNIFLALMFSLIYIRVTFINNIALVILSMLPLLLYNLLTEMIALQNVKLVRFFKIELAITGAVFATLFLLRLHGTPALILLFLNSFIISFLTIWKARYSFYNSHTSRMVIIGFIIGFLPIILINLIPALFFPSIQFHYDFLIFGLIINISIAFLYVFIKDRTIKLSMYSIITFLTILPAYVFFLIYSVLTENSYLSLFYTLLIYTLIFLTLVAYQWWSNKNMQANKNKYFTFSNEKVEILNQINFAKTSYDLYELILSQLHLITQSPQIMLILESSGDFRILANRNVLNSQKLIEILQQTDNSQTIEFNNKAFKFLKEPIEESTLWVVFQLVDASIDVSEVDKQMPLYVQLVHSFQNLHINNEKYIQSPISIEDSIQHKLLNNMDQERAHFSNFLHDEVIQSVNGMRIILQNLSGTSEKDKRIIKLLNDELLSLNKLLRKEINQSTPAMLSLLSFNKNIEMLMGDMNSRYSHTNFEYQINGALEISTQMVTIIYRIIKELNINIGKHADAKQARTSITQADHTLIITIEDNGIGFMQNEDLEYKINESSQHFGLLSVKNDVKWLNGLFQLDSFSGIRKGICITIMIPLNEGKGEENEDFTY